MTPPSYKDLLPFARAYTNRLDERHLHALWLYAQGLNLREVGEQIGKCVRIKGGTYIVDHRRHLSAGRTQQLMQRAVRALSRDRAAPDLRNFDLQQWVTFIIAQLTHEFIVSQANIRSRSRFLTNHPDPSNLDDP